MSEEKPVAAFILSLLGGVFVLAAGIVIALFASAIGLVLVRFTPWIGGAVIILGFTGLILGVLMIIGAVQIGTGEPNKVRTWSIVIIVLSVLSLFVVFGGFIVGFILGLVGGILGLTWKSA